MELLKQFMPYLTGLISVGAFSFTIFKYLHSQKLIRRDKRFEQFRKVFEWVAGRTAEGLELVDTQQAMAIYQLSEFPEYRDISLPIIEYYLEKSNNVDDATLFRAALLFSKNKLNTRRN